MKKKIHCDGRDDSFDRCAVRPLKKADNNDIAEQNRFKYFKQMHECTV